jgi:hypothetical protein
LDGTLWCADRSLRYRMLSDPRESGIRRHLPDH